jgi:hypothetical protein
MGTSQKLKAAALWGAILLATTPALAAGGVAGGGPGAAGAPAGNNAASGGIAATGSASTTGPAMDSPRALGSRGLAGSRATPLGPAGPRTSTGAATNQTVSGGLTPSENSLLLNFGNPTTSAATASSMGRGGISPAGQAGLNAQTNANAAVGNGVGAPHAPATNNMTGSSAINAASNMGGSSNVSGTSSTTNTVPAINQPDPNNPGTLAETLQPSTP